MERRLTGREPIWKRPLRSLPWAAAVAALVAAVVYSNALANGFAYDDVPVLVENASIQDLSALPRAVVEPYWTGGRGGGESGIWRPVTTTVMALEWALWGENPRPFHAVNIALHAAATAAAVLVMGHLATVPAALAGGLIFAVHPVHVEAVANVVGLSELLAALFVLTACALHLRGGRRGETGGPGTSSGRYPVGTIVAISLLYALAFLSKENGAVLPALILLVDAWRERLTLSEVPGYLKRNAFLFGALAVVGVAVLSCRFLVLGGVGSPEPPLGGGLLREVPVIWTLPVVWLHYVRLLLAPADLSPDYSPSVIDVELAWGPENVVGVVLVLGLLALAWATWRRQDQESSGPVAFAVCWFVVAILPVSNIFVLTEILLAERTLYLPSMGVAFAAGVFVRDRVTSGRGKAVAVVIGGAVIIALSVRTWTATPVWESTTTVMNHIGARHPESGRAQWLLADVILDQEPGSATGLAYFSRAVSTTRASYPVVTSLVDHLVNMEAFEPAAALSRYQWEWRPDRIRAPARLAVALSHLERYGEVIEPARAALAMEPDNAVLLHILATAYREEGRLEEAIRYRRAAIEEGEGGRWEQWTWLADLQRRTGDLPGALGSLDSAIVRARDPGVRAVLDSLRSGWEGPGGL